MESFPASPEGSAGQHHRGDDRARFPNYFFSKKSKSISLQDQGLNAAVNYAAPMNSQALRSCFWENTLCPCLLRCTPTVRRRPSAHGTTLATHSTAEHATQSAGALAQVEGLLDREWLLKRPDTQLQHIRGATSAYASESCGGSGGDTLGPTLGPGFWVVRDDLLHPVAGGNKLRKMDALLPQLKNAGATDIVCLPPGQRTHFFSHGGRAQTNNTSLQVL